MVTCLSRERRRLLIAVSLVLVLVLAGCTGQTSDQSSGGEEKLKVGAIVPLSGPLSAFGEPFRKGAQLAVSDLSEEGVDVEVIYSDSRGKPKEGVKVYQKLESVENVDVAFSLGSTVSKSILPQASRDKLPTVTTMAASRGLVDNNSFAFRYWPHPRQIVESALKIVEKGEGDKVAILFPNDQYGRTTGRLLRERAESGGFNVVFQEYYPRTSTDFRTPLTKLKQESPDYIISSPYTPPQLINLVQQKKELDVEGEIIETTLPLTPAMYSSQLESQTHDIVFESQLAEDSSFRQRYKEEYGKPPNMMASIGYDMVKMTAESAGGRSVTGSKFVSDLISLGSFEGLNGQVDVKQNGEINPPLVPVRIVNGSLQRVE